MLRQIDFPPEERNAGPVLAGIMDELKGVARRARTSAENPHNQIAIVADQLLKRSRTVVGNLQEDRAPRPSDARKTTDNTVVEKSTHLCGSNPGSTLGLNTSRK